VLLGVGLPISGAWATAPVMRAVATRAEELGYASVWTLQRLLHPVDEEWGPVYHSVLDPVSALSYVAGFTERIRLGIGVVNMPFYAPLVLSKALTTLDVVSAGRVDVGLGLGWAPQEFTAVGVTPASRGARAEEFVACLRATWTDDEVEFHGKFYELPRCRVEPKPVQRPHPPVLIGGTAEVALRRVGRIADGWISSSRTDLTVIGRSIDVVRSAAAQAGRDPQTLRFIVRGLAQLRADAAADRRPLHGTAEQLREDLAALAAQGVTEVFLDSNYDPRIGAGQPDPQAALAGVEELLVALAPTSNAAH
jgi:probable F420-dependent oxidoreductase